MKQSEMSIDWPELKPLAVVVCGPFKPRTPVPEPSDRIPYHSKVPVIHESGKVFAFGLVGFAHGKARLDYEFCGVYDVSLGEKTAGTISGTKRLRVPNAWVVALRRERALQIEEELKKARERK